MTSQPALTDPWTLGGIRLPNRVLLAPLAGIGNWFVRLQAQRHGAGMAFSEMISSYGIHHGNRRTCEEMLRIHPEERRVALQLFGDDPDVMRSAAATAAQAGAAIIDLNMGCPVPKVCKTGAGAALLRDPERAVALAVAAREGSGLPVTVKLRPGRLPGDRAGVEIAHRLAAEAGVAALTFHPRHSSQQHRGRPDYDLAAELVAELPIPVILSGGLQDPESVRRAYEHTGAAAVMLARGQLGNPWLFEQVLGIRDGEPGTEEILGELGWIMDRAAEHMGEERAARYLRKFYPWYVKRLGADHALNDALQRSDSLAAQRAILRAGELAQAA
jgi:tRNA-dihydrouridine synthase B